MLSNITFVYFCINFFYIKLSIFVCFNCIYYISPSSISLRFPIPLLITIIPSILLILPSISLCQSLSIPLPLYLSLYLYLDISISLFLFLVIFLSLSLFHLLYPSLYLLIDLSQVCPLFETCVAGLNQVK